MKKFRMIHFLLTTMNWLNKNDEIVEYKMCVNMIYIVVSFYPSFNPSVENLSSTLNQRKIKYAKIACRANNYRKYITTFHPKLPIRVN